MYYVFLCVLHAVEAHIAKMSRLQRTRSSPQNLASYTVSEMPPRGSAEHVKPRQVAQGVVVVEDGQAASQSLPRLSPGKVGHLYRPWVDNYFRRKILYIYIVLIPVYLKIVAETSTSQILPAFLTVLYYRHNGGDTWFQRRTRANLGGDRNNFFLTSEAGIHQDGEV